MQAYFSAQTSNTLVTKLSWSNLWGGEEEKQVDAISLLHYLLRLVKRARRLGTLKYAFAAGYYDIERIAMMWFRL